MVVRDSQLAAIRGPDSHAAADRGGEAAAVGPPGDPLHPGRASLDRSDLPAGGRVPEPDRAILAAGGHHHAPGLNGQGQAPLLMAAESAGLTPGGIGQIEAARGRERGVAAALQKGQAHDRLVEPDAAELLHGEAAAEPPLHARHARKPSVSAERSRLRPMKIIRFSRGSSPQGRSGRWSSSMCTPWKT